MTAADIATKADVDALLGELRELRAELAAVRAALPPTLVRGARLREEYGLDPRTAAKNYPAAVVRVGRALFFDLAQLRGHDGAAIARLAREARSDEVLGA